MMAYINVETPTGTVALKKTSEDGVVEGISFTIKGDGFNKTCLLYTSCLFSLPT